jgi:transposase
VICIDARHAKAVLKMQINKSDRNNAIGIARIMQTGWFKEAHVKDIDSHSVRALLAFFKCALKSLHNQADFDSAVTADFRRRWGLSFRG